MFNFTVKEFLLGGDTGTPTLQFYKKGFVLNSNGESPSWQDVILSGNTALTLVNSKANGLNYVKLFGATEQNGTPSPDTPMDIICNNGVVKYGQYGKNLFDKDGTHTHGWYVSNNTISDSPTVNRTVAIRCLPNTTYYIKHCSVKGGARLFYTEVEDWGVGSPCSAAVGTIAADPNVVYSITTSANAKWIFAQYGRGSDITATFEEQAADFILSTEVLTSDTPYEPYHFGIHADGTVETINVHGKNLFDKSMAPAQIYVTDTAQRYGYSFPLKAGTYTVSCSADTSNIYCKTYVGGVYGQALLATNITLTLSEDGYILVYGSSPAIFTDQTNLQLEQGSTATTYEPYFNGGTATAEMLLKVGDYQDVQEVLTGGVIHRCGIKVLDGTENWDTGSSAYSNRFTLAGAFNDIAQIPNANVGYSNCYTVIARSTSIQQNLQNNECGWNTTYVFCLRDDRFTTVAQFKQWLQDQYNAGTPVIIVYPLAEPTTETVAGQPLSIQAGTNIITAEGSIDNLGLEVSYKATI